MDAALWCAVLDAWGFPLERIEPRTVRGGRCTTLILPGPAVDDALARDARSADATLLVTGDASAVAAELDAVRFAPSATRLDQATTEEIVDAMEPALRAAAPLGLVGIWRWPRGKAAALVVDGDVDHPTGVDPECSRYVAPAIATARDAGYQAYGIFAAAANVRAEPDSFPPGAEYYNHSFTHPYSHWNPDPWGSLDAGAMEAEISRAAETYRTTLGTHDRGMFRLPHFQLEAWDRTADVLERLGYRADSSIGANVSVTGGLPFQPARAPWSDRSEDAAYARTHPDPRRRRPFLQVPISTDPTDPGFRHGCCSYNTLGEGVRDRTAAPADYAEVLEDVLRREVDRRGLAHLFIDPPDAGYGRLPGDRPDHATAVGGFLERAVRRSDLAIMSTAALVDWWLDRAAAVSRLRWRVAGGGLEITLDGMPAGTTLAIWSPGGRWSLHPIEEEP
ncbi:MAG TPA: hypothetical protein VFT27_05300 [Actinomycetota bacterium]|nr:hypothetical protein [Actinomycetota bacterium]